MAGNRLARIYYDFQDYDTALKYGYEIMSDVDSLNRRNQILLYNIMAACYEKKNKLDSAIHYHIKTSKIKDHMPGGIWYGIAMGNIGKIYVEQKRYSDAINLLQIGIDTCTAYNEHANVVSFKCKLAEAFLFQGQKEKSNQIMNNVRKQLYDHYSHRSAFTYYTTSKKINTILGNYKVALSSNDSITKIQKIIDFQYSTEEKVKNETKMQLQKVIDKEEKLKAQVARQKFIRNMLLLLTAIASVGFIFYRSNHNRKFNAEKSYSKKKQIELDEAQHALNSLTQKWIKDTERIESLEQQIENTLTSDRDTEDKRSMIKDLRNQTILTDEDWNKFMEKFDKVHINFIENVKNKFVDISPAELRFLCLTKLSMNNKEMAAILGVSPDAMRNTKSRFKKKFAIESDESLMDVVMNC
jgi:tetratricopeptide (TPR) repeat protein